jgi:hypothetical protein
MSQLMIGAAALALGAAFAVPAVANTHPEYPPFPPGTCNPIVGTAKYQQCLQESQNQAQCGDIRGCAGGGVPGLIMSPACQQAGIC